MVFSFAFAFVVELGSNRRELKSWKVKLRKIYVTLARGSRMTELSGSLDSVLSIGSSTRRSSGGYSVESRRVYFTAFKYRMEKKRKIIIDI